ncbi:MAG: hypothetical protein COA78_05750 [Blastopirellula sp.]|nr:MAG: hypothetical protein COA78_05750 [Blastopirellula sp.]
MSLNLYAVIAVVDTRPYFTYVVDENVDEVSSRVRRVIPENASISNIINICKANDDDLGNIHLVPNGANLKFEHFNPEILQLITVMATLICRLRSISSCVTSMMADVGYNKFVYTVRNPDGKEINHSVCQPSLEAAHQMAREFVLATYSPEATIHNLKPVKRG